MTTQGRDGFAVARPGWFYASILAVAGITLVLQIVNTRLLSVLTWYHLAFLAISLAMLGLTAGAVLCYLRPPGLDAEGRPRWLVGPTVLFALSVPLSHWGLLRSPLPTELDGWSGVGPLILAGVIAAVPFFFAGIVLALVLTQARLPIGRLYAADLIGAGLGCLMAIPLLDLLDPSSVALLLGACGLVSAIGFQVALGSARQASPWRRGWPVAVAALLVGAALANHAMDPHPLRLTRMKGRDLPPDLMIDRWNSHSRITATHPRVGPPALWGKGAAAPDLRVRQVPLRIDGGAFTAATAFGGDAAELNWLRWDVTTLAYHLRREPKVAVIGVGGGRDLLTAVGFGASSVVGIEVNGILLELLRGELLELTSLADRPDVRLEHDDGRSFLARTDERFDLLQMALVDTWASTSAGAMTLSENGLYTLEAWRLFASRLNDEGILTVSRFYAPNRPGETARLLSLAVATLLEEGVERPLDHLALARAERVATLLLKRTPFTAAERGKLARVSRRHGFGFLLRPGEPPDDALLRPIATATSRAELAQATAHPVFDLSAATDARPFFFNMLKPSGWLGGDDVVRQAGGVLAGNLQATGTLLSILLAVAFLALLTIVGPLLALGRGHGLAPARFTLSAAYFGLIGFGFMLVEIALLQRFSILLGHPIYSLTLTLMSLILSTGLGAALSDRYSLDRRWRAGAIPGALAGAILLAAVASEAMVQAMVGASLIVRAATVFLFTAPLGLLLGFAFPVGLRLLRRHSSAALSWMWGLNGAFGVLGSVAAVLLAMAGGIDTTLYAGAVCYLLLLPVALGLWTGVGGSSVGATPAAGRMES